MRDLEARITAPLDGENLPMVVFAHGFGSSLDGYAPLIDYWASRGLVVLQTTHADSRRLLGQPGAAEAGSGWRERALDLVRLIDDADALLAAVPGLRPRVDISRIASAGHSFGGQTAGVLLGLRVKTAGTGEPEGFPDQRVRAGVLLATAGNGGADLTPFASHQFPQLQTEFAQMSKPALVVMGERDSSPLTWRGPDWTADPYTLSPAPKHLLRVYGGEHSLGGIVGYDSAETTDENPARLRFVQRVTAAYLRHVLGVGSDEWAREREVLQHGTDQQGRLLARE